MSARIVRNIIGSCGDERYALDWAGVVRFTVPTVGLVALLGALVSLTLGAGCASNQPDHGGASANVAVATSTTDAPQASALQVSPPTASTPANAPPTQAPADASPSIPATSDPVAPAAPTLAASTGAAADASSGGSSYTVQRGDTLFRIAREHYGDGKQWKRIASANPGLTPASLKAGQTIVLP